MECGRCAGCPVIDDALPDSAVTNGEYDDFVLEYGWEKKDESESEGEEDDIWSC